MIFIIDANIIFSALMKEGKNRELLIDCPFKLYTPEIVIASIRKYEDLIIQKSGLSKSDLETLLNLLLENITVVQKETYQNKLREALDLIGHIDKDDAPYLAVALSVANDGVWSDDVHFTKQKKIKVWTSPEIIKEFNTVS